MRDYTADLNWLQDNIRDWAKKRQILARSTPQKQFEKTMEETLELGEAIKFDHFYKVVDGIGDVLVTLVIIAEMHGITLNQCLEHAWLEIADRRGKLVNGVFVKEQR